MSHSEDLWNRRSLLKAGGLLAAGAVAATAGAEAVHASTTAPDWAALDRALKGTLFRPGQTGYASAHQLFNPRFDSVQPAAVVRAGSVEDVRQAILFARKNKLVCVPKGGGHSYVGASTIAGGLMIDLGPLRGLTYASNAIQIGAGARLYDVHAYLDRFARSLPTGTCPTVGIAGLALGGGMGIHTRTYGLTSDRVLSLQVVTADGVVRTASLTQNADLYWALRGGGGGNLGIVTSFRLATIGAGKLGFFRLTWPESKAAAVVRGWQRFAKEAPSTAWANLHVTGTSTGGLSIHVVGVSTTGSATAAAAQLESFVGARGATRSISVKTHLEAVRYFGGGTTSPRQGWLAGSDVLRGPMDAATINGLLGAVRTAARAKVAASAILDPLGGQAAKQPPGGSAWPWRSALGVIQWYSGLPSRPTTAQLRAAQSFVTNGHHAVTRFSAGGYVNYLEAGRSNNSYYGSSLSRLHAIKLKYDPTNFFHAPYTFA
ncbi:FAD-linked oxidase [Kribbella sp. ALI-6-A]|uniref:FAD-dependent oxidoreductase n=1 Tax=Kribbella sp. ALI-6-A TaxID=1933817 RepID=UPI00097C60F0|nr:FAD-binding oxidoreductase [Kribbella sp. ALI-6-A]ONI74268.1 FAD-linked oxidase [Kribbella sp. ALI-6-A]